jgi:hypothetical protein
VIQVRRTRHRSSASVGPFISGLLLDAALAVTPACTTIHSRSRREPCQIGHL